MHDATTPRRIVILGANERLPTLLNLFRAQDVRLLVVLEGIDLYRKNLASVDVIEGDFLDPKILAQANLEHCDAVIILADTHNNTPQDADARSVVATLSVERINSDVRTIVEVFSDDTAYHLRNAGVDEVIQSGELTADILAFSTTHPNYSKHLKTLLHFAYKNRVVTASASERLQGKPVSEISHILARDRKVLLGVRIRGRADRISLDPSRVVTDRDEMIYVHIL